MQHFLKIGKLLENGTVKFESSKKFASSQVRKFASSQVQILKFKSSKFKFTEIFFCNPGQAPPELHGGPRRVASVPGAITGTEERVNCSGHVILPYPRLPLVIAAPFLNESDLVGIPANAIAHMWRSFFTRQPIFAGFSKYVPTFHFHSSYFEICSLSTI